VLVHTVYLTGIALLFPLIVNAYETGVAPWILDKTHFSGALTLIVLGAFVLWYTNGKLGKTLKSLGWMKIVPGTIAIAFFLFGKDSFYGTARTSITGFSIIEPVVKPLFEHSLPTLEIFAVGYVLLGICFVWLGNKMEQFWE
jgi:hypothetical protein